MRSGIAAHESLPLKAAALCADPAPDVPLHDTSAIVLLDGPKVGDAPGFTCPEVDARWCVAAEDEDDPLLLLFSIRRAPLSMSEMLAKNKLRKWRQASGDLERLGMRPVFVVVHTGQDQGLGKLLSSIKMDLRIVAITGRGLNLLLPMTELRAQLLALQPSDDGHHAEALS